VRNKNRSILLFIALVLTCAASVSAQVQIELKPNEPKKEEKNASAGRWQIPEASVSAGPEVKAWCDGLRDAAKAVRDSHGDRKDRKRFAQALVEGATKSFNPPIDDRKPFYLVMAEPEYTEDARRHRVSGRIMLRVEFRADGTVGQVRTLNSLGYGLDEAAITAARNAVFIPAVRNGAFVDFTNQVLMNFAIY
jgi:TonB family protein